MHAPDPAKFPLPTGADSPQPLILVGTGRGGTGFKPGLRWVKSSDRLRSEVETCSASKTYAESSAEVYRRVESCRLLGNNFIDNPSVRPLSSELDELLAAHCGARMSGPHDTRSTWVRGLGRPVALDYRAGLPTDVRSWLAGDLTASEGGGLLGGTSYVVALSYRNTTGGVGLTPRQIGVISESLPAIYRAAEEAGKSKIQFWWDKSYEASFPLRSDSWYKGGLEAFMRNHVLVLDPAISEGGSFNPRSRGWVLLEMLCASLGKGYTICGPGTPKVASGVGLDPPSVRSLVAESLFTWCSDDVAFYSDQDCRTLTYWAILEATSRHLPLGIPNSMRVPPSASDPIQGARFGTAIGPGLFFSGEYGRNDGGWLGDRMGGVRRYAEVVSSFCGYPDLGYALDNERLYQFFNAIPLEASSDGGVLTECFADSVSGTFGVRNVNRESGHEFCVLRGETWTTNSEVFSGPQVFPPVGEGRPVLDPSISHAEFDYITNTIMVAGEALHWAAPLTIGGQRVVKVVLAPAGGSLTCTPLGPDECCTSRWGRATVPDRQVAIQAWVYSSKDAAQLVKLGDVSGSFCGSVVRDRSSFCSVVAHGRSHNRGPLAALASLRLREKPITSELDSRSSRIVALGAPRWPHLVWRGGVQPLSAAKLSGFLAAALALSGPARTLAVLSCGCAAGALLLAMARGLDVEPTALSLARWGCSPALSAVEARMLRELVTEAPRATSLAVGGGEGRCYMANPTGPTEAPPWPTISEIKKWGWTTAYGARGDRLLVRPGLPVLRLLVKGGHGGAGAGLLHAEPAEDTGTLSAAEAPPDTAIGGIHETGEPHVWVGRF